MGPNWREQSLGVGEGRGGVGEEEGLGERQGWT